MKNFFIKILHPDFFPAVFFPLWFVFFPLWKENWGHFSISLNSAIWWHIFIPRNIFHYQIILSLIPFNCFLILGSVSLEKVKATVSQNPSRLLKSLVRTRRHGSRRCSKKRMIEWSFNSNGHAKPRQLSFFHNII